MHVLYFVSAFSWFAPLVLAYFPTMDLPYCTKNISTHAIPQLTAAQQSLVTSLLQVQSVSRHGSRTPYANFSCWKDYEVVWNDCNVTELMLSSPSQTSQTDPPAWLFRKIYDASPNYFGGNCLTGQMVSAGYYQEEGLGWIMRDAYLNTEAGWFPLFNSTDWREIDTNKIYLRSDDEQRTLMSGQLLLQGMFNQTQYMDVVVHTGDKALDQIAPNTKVCPYLNTISDNAYASDNFIAENTSTSVDTLTSELDDIFGAGYWTWYNVMDCMYTTVCTDQDIPSQSSTVEMTDALFNTTVIQAEFAYAYRCVYNDSEWSKLAMGNMIWWIKTRIEAMTNATSGTSSTPSNGDDTAYKLVVYSAHDTSIMPILAALLGEGWDAQWSAYASIVTFELYAGNLSTSTIPYYFRIVYNNEPLLLPGCSDTLCDVNELIAAMDFAQELMPGCSYPSASSYVYTPTDDSSNDNAIGTGGWVGLSLMSTAVGAGFTALALYLHSVWGLRQQGIQSKISLAKFDDL